MGAEATPIGSMIRQTGNTETLRAFNKALELLQSPAADSEEQLRNMLMKAKATEERTEGGMGGTAGFRKGPNPGGLRRGATQGRVSLGRCGRKNPLLGD